jgi:ferredoxin
MIEVTLLPSGQKVEVAQGTTLMVAIQRAGLPIGQSCGSVAVCAKCGVRVIEGASNLSVMKDVEAKLLKRDSLPSDFRLTCLAKIHGPVTVQADYW